MASSKTPQAPSLSHSAPPSWYNLQTSKYGQPYISLPAKPSTPPIFLTNYQARDGPALQAILEIPSINDALISVPRPYTLADADFWIDLQLSSPSTPWLQALRSEDPDTGTFVGCVSLTPATSSTYALPGQADMESRSQQQPEHVLGYYLHPDFRQRGVMRDAVLALLAWAVAEQGVTRVRVDVAVENLGSRRLVEGLHGFERQDGEGELVWPESKGGGSRKVWTWRWRCS